MTVTTSLAGGVAVLKSTSSSRSLSCAGPKGAQRGDPVEFAGAEGKTAIRRC